MLVSDCLGLRGGKSIFLGLKVSLSFLFKILLAELDLATTREDSQSTLGDATGLAVLSLSIKS